MKGNPDVMKVLAGALAMERALNMQYWLDWRCLADMGAGETAGKFHEFKKNTHKWMRKLQDQILMYEGNAVTDIATPVQGTSVLDVLQRALTLETNIASFYEKAIDVCLKASDHDTRDLFDHNLKQHTRGDRGMKGHVWWLEKQVHLLGDLMKDNEGDYILEMH